MNIDEEKTCMNCKWWSSHDESMHKNLHVCMLRISGIPTESIRNHKDFGCNKFQRKT